MDVIPESGLVRVAYEGCESAVMREARDLPGRHGVCCRMKRRAGFFGEQCRSYAR